MTMTVKLNSLARWANLDADQAIVFEGTDVAERRVRINFNLEGVTSFFIGTDEAERFLCTIGPGLETVEFNTKGTFKVYAENGSGAVQYQSADLEPTFAVIPDPVIFTRIANRRHRNPELEEMMFRMNQNIERRLAAQAQEMEAVYARRLEAIANATAQEPAAPVVEPAPSGTGVQPVPAQGATGENTGETAAAPTGSEPAGSASGGTT